MKYKTSHSHSHEFSTKEHPWGWSRLLPTWPGTPHRRLLGTSPVSRAEPPHLDRTASSARLPAGNNKKNVVPAKFLTSQNRHSAIWETRNQTRTQLGFPLLTTTNARSFDISPGAMCPAHAIKPNPHEVGRWLGRIFELPFRSFVTVCHGRWRFSMSNYQKVTPNFLAAWLASQVVWLHVTTNLGRNVESWQTMPGYSIGGIWWYNYNLNNPSIMGFKPIKCTINTKQIHTYTGWWLTCPSEKWWTSSVGMIIPFPTEWKVIKVYKSHVPNHQSVYIYNIIYTHKFYAQFWFNLPKPSSSIHQSLNPFLPKDGSTNHSW